MIENLPQYINVLFILTTAVSLFLFYKATDHSNLALVLLLVWLLVQGLVGYSKFYTNTNTTPPRFIMLTAPPLMAIAVLFLSQKGKKFIDSLDIKILTYLQIVRIPVEIVLFLLFLNMQVPELMTFEGRNFDILAGLTAPFIAYFGFTKKALSRKILIAWNLICIGLLFNIVIIAVLSAPFNFQQFAFDHPNVAVLYFPFVWLPGFIVPLVLFSHLASIRKLLNH